MAKAIELDEVDQTEFIRLDSLACSDHAMRGEVGTASFILDDPTGTYTPPAMKTAVVYEDEAGVNERVFSGYVAERTASRGTLRAGSGRQWEVTCEDLNAMLDDNIAYSSDNPDRPAETDYERVTWLLGSSLLPGYSAGSVPNTNTKNMDARDYTGLTARDVLEDCAQRAQKNFFLYDYGDGLRLYYNLTQAAVLTSTVVINDGAVTDWTASPPTVAPADVQFTLDPQRVFSTIRLEYDGGVSRDTKSATENAFRRREKNVVNKNVKTSGHADDLVAKLLDSLDSEMSTVRLTIHAPMAHVNDIKAGMRVLITSRVAGISNDYRRVIAREVRPRAGDAGVSGEEYSVVLTLADEVWATKLWQKQ